jgi:ribosomal protein L24E
VSRRHRPLFRAGLALVATALLGALPVVTPTPRPAEATSAPVSGTPGYWLVGGDGSVYPFGSASDRGSLRGKPLSRPVVGMAATPSGAGYWMVGSDGGIFSFGDAGFHGSTGALKLNQPIVGMAATPSGKGYWFVAADGGIFSFGDAGFHGSTGNLKLNKPIVGMAPTPTGKGYWFVASDGGIFSFGDAAFYGSTGAISLNRPIVGMAPTPTGKGYWFVASDGGIFSFGDAAFYGSTGAMKLAKPITGMAASPSGRGYWFVASDGGIFNFGDAAFFGSAGGTALPAGIVVMSAGLLPSPGTVPTTPTTAPSGPGTTTTTVPPTREPYEIGLIGDTGYSSEHSETFNRVVQHMNGYPLAFVAHDGDIKDPLSPCTDSPYDKALAAFNRSAAPLVYTPGDNEWMDCAATAKEPKDSNGQLAKIRQMFFSSDQSLGATTMTLERQADYPENARWTKEGVVFATINAPGPNDNLPYDVDHPDTPEAGPRRLANVAWLNATFDQAEATNAAGVMIIWQANPWQFFAKSWTYLTDVLRSRTTAFGKPVVLVHGDTHVHRIDQGGKANADGSPDSNWPAMSNFTRVETYASGPPAGGTGPIEPAKWIRVTVDPKSPQVFTFTSEQAG